jgi:periplasmic divalent cation tolerance protein
MTEQPTDPIVVLMTAGSREEAARLADIIVTARLAACVQILPEIESVYHWKGTVERAPEILLLAKTTKENFTALESAVRALHSYETPEIIALPITAASAPYLEWLTANVLLQGRDVSQAQASAAVANGKLQES